MFENNASKEILHADQAAERSALEDWIVRHLRGKHILLIGRELNKFRIQLQELGLQVTTIDAGPEPTEEDLLEVSEASIAPLYWSTNSEGTPRPCSFEQIEREIHFLKPFSSVCVLHESVGSLPIPTLFRFALSVVDDGDRFISATRFSVKDREDRVSLGFLVTDVMPHIEARDFRANRSFVQISGRKNANGHKWIAAYRELLELRALPHTLSYQLGRTLADAGSSLRGFLFSPFQFYKLLSEYMRRKRMRHLGKQDANRAANAAQAERRIRNAFGRRGPDAAERIGERFYKKELISKEVMHRILFDVLREMHFPQALAHADAALRLNHDNSKLLGFLAEVVNRHIRLGQFEEALSLADMVRRAIGYAGILPEIAAYHRTAKAGAVLPLMTVLKNGRVVFSEIAGLDNDSVRAALETSGVTGIERLILRHLPQEDLAPLEVERNAFEMIQPIDSKLALQYGEDVFARSGNKRFGKALCDFHRHCGNLRRAYEIVQVLNDCGQQERTRKMLEAQIQLLDHGFPLPALDHSLPYIPKAKKSFYFLHNSLPYASGGYATRTHGLLCGIQASGFDIAGLSRFGFPLDLKKGTFTSAPEKDVIDGIDYHRMLTFDRGYGTTPLTQYLADYSDAAYAKVREEGPSVIHAASNFMNGVVCNWVGRKLGIPTVYEVRGLWEVTRSSRQSEW